MPAPVTDAEAEAIRAHFAAHGSVRAAAASVGRSFPAARRVLGAGAHQNDAPAETRRVEQGNDQTVEFASDRPVRTLEEAVAFADVDLTTWRVDRWECGGWQTGMKLRAFDTPGVVASETPVVKQLWRVKLYLKRVVPRAEREALEKLAERFRSPPNWPKPGRVGPPTGPHMMVMDLVDCHFGKLAWAPETGQNYDLKIADRVYREAVEDLLSRSACYPVEEFLLPLGSDFLHVDNAGGTTTAGTPQDVDGRLAKIIEVAEAAVVYAVSAMADRGRVAVKWVPGNHDRLLSYMLARVIAAVFAKHPRVTVDAGPAHRKYHRYHGTLIGLTHGDREKHAALPAIMAQERGADWAGTACREWHVGHRHTSRTLAFMALDTHGGVPVRTLRSLSAVDAWHFNGGFVGGRRSAEAYLYSRAGFVGSFVADVRPEQGAKGS